MATARNTTRPTCTGGIESSPLPGATSVGRVSCHGATLIVWRKSHTQITAMRTLRITSAVVMTYALACPARGQRTFAGGWFCGMKSSGAPGTL